jgi:hypothetical protein
MIVSAAMISQFDGDRSKKVIGGLTRLFAEINHTPPPGFVESQLLREDKGDALLLTKWESRTDLGNFMASEQGKALALGFAKLVGGKTAMKDYFVTWQTDTFTSGGSRCGCGNSKERMQR